MKKIIIIDDQGPSTATVGYWIGEDINELTDGRYGAKVLAGAIITDSLSLIKKLVEEIRKEDDTVAGLLIDFVDETHKVFNAGAVLLHKVKSDQKLKKIPVVIYTSKNVEEFSPSSLVKNGAKAAIRRKSTGTRGEQAKQVLHAFNIPYTSSRTGSPGPH